MPERPLLIRLDEAALLNVDNRVRENLCAEAAKTLRMLMLASERLSDKTLEISGPRLSSPAPDASKEDWAQLYWLASDVHATLGRLRGKG